jgi:hypothetical protein
MFIVYLASPKRFALHHYQHVAGDVVRSVGRKEDGGSLQIIFIAESAQRYFSSETLLCFPR